MTTKDLILLAGTRPLSLKSERTLAHWNDPQVRLAWAKKGDHNPEVLQERISVETDALVLEALGRHGAFLSQEFSQRMCAHEDGNVALTAALATSCPDALTAATLRRVRGQNKHTFLLLLQERNLAGLAGKDLSVAEIIRHSELSQVRRVVALATGPVAQEALLYRLHSLDEDNPHRDSLLREARRLSWSDTLHPRFVFVLGRYPTKYAKEIAAEAAAQAEKQRQAQELTDLAEWAKTPEGQEKIFRRLGINRNSLVSMMGRTRTQATHKDKMVETALRSGTWSVTDTLLLARAGRSEDRDKIYLRLSGMTLTLEETQMLLLDAYQHDGSPGLQLQVLERLPVGMLVLALAGLRPMVRDSYLNMIATKAKGVFLEAFWDQIDDTWKASLSTLILQRAVNSIPQGLLYALPSRKVHASKHGQAVLAQALEDLPEGVFEVYVSLSESEESVQDVLEAARNTGR